MHADNKTFIIPENRIEVPVWLLAGEKKNPCDLWVSYPVRTKPPTHHRKLLCPVASAALVEYHVYNHYRQEPLQVVVSFV